MLLHLLGLFFQVITLGMFVLMISAYLSGSGAFKFASTVAAIFSFMGAIICDLLISEPNYGTPWVKFIILSILILFVLIPQIGKIRKTIQAHSADDFRFKSAPVL